MEYFPPTVEAPSEEVTLLICYTDHLLLNAYLHSKDKFVKFKYNLFYEMYHISASTSQVIRNLFEIVPK